VDEISIVSDMEKEKVQSIVAEKLTKSET